MGGPALYPLAALAACALRRAWGHVHARTAALLSLPVGFGMHASRLKLAPTLSDDSAREPPRPLGLEPAQSRPQPQAAAPQLGRQRGLMEGDERGVSN